MYGRMVFLPTVPALVGAFAVRESMTTSQAVGAEVLCFNMLQPLSHRERVPLGADV